jgi:hypothetical protein
MGGHLHNTFGAVAGEHRDPPVMWEQTRPVLYRAGRMRNTSGKARCQ